MKKCGSRSSGDGSSQGSEIAAADSGSHFPVPFSAELFDVSASAGHRNQQEFHIHLFRFPQTLVVRRHFHAVATHTHAAPTPAVILGGVVEEEDARGVLTLFDEG